MLDKEEIVFAVRNSNAYVLGRKYRVEENDGEEAYAINVDDPTTFYLTIRRNAKLNTTEQFLEQYPIGLIIKGVLIQ